MIVLPSNRTGVNDLRNGIPAGAYYRRCSLAGYRGGNPLSRLSNHTPQVISTPPLFGYTLLIRSRRTLPILHPGVRMGECLHLQIASKLCSHEIGTLCASW